MASRRPTGIWVIALTTLTLSAYLVLELALAYLESETGDLVQTVWETGMWPIWISLFAVAIASVIGVLLRRRHARIGLVAAVLAPVGWFLAEVPPQLELFRRFLPDYSGSFTMWADVLWAPLLLLLSALVAACYLYSGRTQEYFSERPCAWVA